MKTGRNEPCPCGSGKKYKKCCLGKVPEVPESVEAAPERPGAGAGAGARDDPSDDFGERFEAASLDERLTLAKGVIEDATDFDGELGLELYDGVAGLADQGRFAELDALIDLIAQRQPEAFEADRPWYLNHRFANALLGGRDVRPLVLEIARVGNRQPEKLAEVIWALMYTDRGALALEAARVALPVFRGDEDVFSWAVDELEELATLLAVEAVIAKRPDASADDPEILAALRVAEPVGEADDGANDDADDSADEDVEDADDEFDDDDEIEEDDGDSAAEWEAFWADYLAIRTGRLAAPRRAEDYAYDAPEPERSISLLSFELAGWLVERHAWPRLRAQMAAWEIEVYLQQRFTEKRPKGKERHGEAGRRTSGQRRSPFTSWLTPESVSELLEQLVGDFGVGPHRTAAVAMALPRLAELLVERGLLSNGDASSLTGRLAAVLGSTARSMASGAYGHQLKNDILGSCGLT